MKRIALAVFAAAALVNNGWSTGDTYTIYGYQNVTVPPIIDATNFVNYGVLDISTTYPFEFSNVQNFTNRNLMSNSFSGFRFDTAPSGAGIRRMARNFCNAPSVPSGSATISGGTHVLVSATNILNRGLLETLTPGLVKLEGMRVDLSRSQLGTAAPFSPAFTTLYSEIGSNQISPASDFVLEYPSVGPYQVISPPNFTNFTSMNLFNFGFGTTLTAQEFIYESDDNKTVQIVFIRNFDTNVTVAVESSGGSPNNLGQVTVQWSAAEQTASGPTVTNTLYLTDTYGSFQTNLFAGAGYTIRPQNFSFSFSAAFGNGDPGEPFTDKTPDFWGEQSLIDNALYSAWDFSFGNDAYRNQVGGPRLLDGRVEIDAGQSLDLSYSRVKAYNYARVVSTNHFVGADNGYAAISAPYLDLKLGSTNGVLRIDSLVPDEIYRFSGAIDVYSTVWTNTVDTGTATNTVLFNVVMVDSSLTPAGPPHILDLSLRSTNLFISDSLVVASNMSIQADALTVTTNGTLSLDPDYTWNTIPWNTGAPGLKFLTNAGTIFSRFGDLIFQAADGSGGAVPYRQFVNTGLIRGAGIMVHADDVLVSGTNRSDYGLLQVIGETNVILDGALLRARQSDIMITSPNLIVSNSTFDVGRAIYLSVTGEITAGPGTWTVYDGFNLLAKPAAGDLLEVTLINYAIDFQESFNTWAGEDLGPTNAGFTNNAALGAMHLDGGLYSLFTFSGTGPDSNAMYLDVLYLDGYATNRDADGNLTALKLNPGMKIYFAQALMDNGNGGYTDVTTSLTNKNGGGLVWVDHAGPQSKPAVILSPGLKVSIETEPILRSKVTWTATTGTTNLLYRIANPYGSDWQLVTNFVTGAAGEVSVYEPVQDTARFYKVRVDSSSP